MSIIKLYSICFYSSMCSPAAGCQLSDDQVCGWDSHKLAASILIGRWDLCLEVFGRAFMDTVGMCGNACVLNSSNQILKSL